MKNLMPVFIGGLALFAPPLMADLDIATGNGYEPFTDESLPAGGLATELVVEAFAAVDEEVAIDFRPWARGYHDTLWGEFAGTFPYVHTDGRAEDMLYSSEPLATLREIVISTADNPIDYTGPESLEGLSICRAVGYAIPGVVEDMIESGDLDVTEPSDMASCPRMVELGRVDFFIPNNFTWPGLVISESLDEGNFHVSDDNPVAESPLYFIAPRTSAGEEVIELFDEGLATLRSSGRYDEIFAAHVEQAAE